MVAVECCWLMEVFFFIKGAVDVVYCFWWIVLEMLMLVIVGVMIADNDLFFF